MINSEKVKTGVLREIIQNKGVHLIVNSVNER